MLQLLLFDETVLSPYL